MNKDYADGLTPCPKVWEHLSETLNSQLTFVSSCLKQEHRDVIPDWTVLTIIKMGLRDIVSFY